MRWTTTLALCTIAVITLYALFLSHAHATTTVDVTPSSGAIGTTFSANATTTLTVPAGGKCIQEWYRPSAVVPFRTTTTYAEAEQAGWSVVDTWDSTGETVTGTYTVKGRFYDQNGDPLEAGASDTFELTEVPVFPLGLIVPVIVLIVFFVIIDKKFMKPHGASISKFLLRRSCGAPTNRNSIL